MRKLFVSAVALSTLFAHTANAIIAVEDVPSLIQQIKGYLVQAKSLSMQAQQVATQIQQYSTELEQLQAFVHDPSLGPVMGLMNQTGLSNDLPINPYAVQSLTSGYGGLLSKVGSLGNLVNSTYATNHVYSPTDGSWNSQQLIANGNGIAGTQGAAQAAYQNLRNHMPVLQALRDRLATARTPKDVEDASAQIAAENAWTASTNSQLHAIEVNYRIEADSRVQRDNESLDKGIDDFLAQAKAAGRGL